MGASLGIGMWGCRGLLSEVSGQHLVFGLDVFLSSLETLQKAIEESLFQVLLLSPSLRTNSFFQTSTSIQDASRYYIVTQVCDTGHVRVSRVPGYELEGDRFFSHLDRCRLVSAF